MSSRFHMTGLALALSLAFVAATPPASATTHIFNVSPSFVANRDNQGQWSNTEGHDQFNDNYVVGRRGDGAVVYDWNRQDYRNFFSFNLGSLDLAGQKVVAARLELQRYGYASPDPFETYGLFDVSTPVLTLKASGGPNPTLYEDLGAGDSYGLFEVGPGAETSIVSFDLNSVALADIEAAAGGTFTVGGALPDMTGTATRYLFAFSSGDGVQRLVIETADPMPEPGSLMLLIVGATPMLLRLRRRFRPMGD